VPRQYDKYKVIRPAYVFSVLNARPAPRTAARYAHASTCNPKSSSTTTHHMPETNISDALRPGDVADGVAVSFGDQTAGLRAGEHPLQSSTLTVTPQPWP
jgi:hypothetical protein